MCDSALHEFVASQRELLELELKSEECEERSIASSLSQSVTSSKNEEEHPSNVLRSLEVSDVSVGLYGRTVVTLSVLSGDPSKPETMLLPSHRFSVGDEVEVLSRQQPSKENAGGGGVISALSETTVSVALFAKRGAAAAAAEDTDDEEDMLGPPPLALIPKSSVEVHRKLVKALNELEEHGADHRIAGRVIEALFGLPQTFPECTSSASLGPWNTQLDASQIEAISFALNCGNRPISLIHGPPGTGKTTVVAELIHQAVHVHKMKVLVTAPSNVAVDNVLERLLLSAAPVMKRVRRKQQQTRNRLRTVRLGHPARIKASILPYSLESLVQNADGTEIVADVRHELQGFLRILSNPKSRGSDKRAAYREVKALRKEVKLREEKVVKELITQAQVVLATNVGAANRILDQVEGGFDLVVIDEAAQALEASCWIPILRGKQVVLAGDHCQLPPTIKSQAAKKELGRTLFDRAMEMYGDKRSAGRGKISRMLQVQYRMHKRIANWASDAMYNGKLKTGVESRTLSELPHVTGSESESLIASIEAPLVLIDTTGCGMHESVNNGGSRYNDGEAQLVAQHVHSLVRMGLKPEEIAVISPYNGQVELLRQLLLPDIPKLEIRSVDGFQGGEREAVVISLVRSSERGGIAGIGFLKDDRRLNVAVTRAKRQCMVICDCETVSRSDFLSGLISYMETHGDYHSAAEFISANETSIEGDVLDGEAELLRMMKYLPKKHDEELGSSPAATSELQKGVNSVPTETSAPDRTASEGKEMRKALLDKIASFAETGRKGDKMPLSPELSSFDRRVVHEFAEQLGLGHHSEGVSGADRRMILTIEKEKAVKADDSGSLVSETHDTEANEDVPHRTMSTAFAALNTESEESSESEHDDNSTVRQPMNQLLGSLAKERLERQSQKESSGSATQRKTAKKKKKKGQKLGGKKPVIQDSKEEDELDDMAFLDAQIEKVQTSHGRKVEGKGEYRSIVNGILIAKPPSRDQTQSSKSSSALNAKLRQAQEGRRKKEKRK